MKAPTRLETDQAHPRPERRVRVNRTRLYEVLDRARKDRGINWTRVADEVGTASSTFSRLKKGLGIDADTFAAILDWLGATPDSFFGRAQTVEVRAFPSLTSYVSKHGELSRAEVRTVDLVATRVLQTLREHDRSNSVARRSSRRERRGKRKVVARPE